MYMENKKYHILVCPDKNYVEHTSIMLTSLFENNINNAFYVHVFEYNGSFGESGKNILQSVFSKYNAEYYFYELSDDLLKGFPYSGPNQMEHISISAYLRIFVARFIPKEINKILYIDGDVIVSGDLSELFETNIEKVPFAAAPDVYMHDVKHMNTLSIPVTYGYFNSGVLLINLDIWRKNDVEKRCLEFIKKNPHLLKFFDQDCLNAVLYKEHNFFNIKYNFQTVFMAPQHRKIEYTYDDEIMKAFENPVIIHYTGGDKPWFENCEHPLAKYYIEYRNKTVWANSPLYKRHLSLRQKLWDFKVKMCRYLTGYPTKMNYGNEFLR